MSAGSRPLNGLIGVRPHLSPVPPQKSSQRPRAVARHAGAHHGHYAGPRGAHPPDGHGLDEGEAGQAPA